MDKKRLEEQFNFRTDLETLGKLRYLADLTQRTQSNYLRWLIDREYKVIQVAEPEPSKAELDEAMEHAEMVDSMENAVEEAPPDNGKDQEEE